MFANGERERDWCRHIKVNIPSADRQVEREREMSVFFLNFVSFFFYSENLSTYFKVCVDLCNKKSDRTRCLAVSILEYNERKRFGFLKEEQNSVVIHG